MEILVSPAEFPRPEEVARRAHGAASHVGLADRLQRLELIFDAPEFEGSGFWQFERTAAGKIHGRLYGAPADALLRSGPAHFEGLPQTVRVARVDLVDALDLLRLDRWLHRNLLQLDDLLRRRVRPDEVDRHQAEAMQSCWDVWTDGRLRGWQHPGLSLAERRRLFFRVFGSAGTLLPRHWEIFHDLWEGRLEGHEGLLRALSALPKV